MRRDAEAPVPLRFFHFSGLCATEPDVISKNTDRFRMGDRPDLRPLFDAYKAVLRSNEGHPSERLPYGFDQFSDGTSVSRLARRLFAAHQAHFAAGTGRTFEDPFAATGTFANFARRQRLVKGKVKPASATWKQCNPNDRRVGAVHRLLRLALRALGPHRYELLMRYLAHVSVLRHQAAFLRDARWPDPASDEGRS